MKVIYKYHLKLEGEQTLSIPEGYRIMSAGEQFGDLFLWVMVNPEAQLTEKKIYIFGTGHSLIDNINVHPFIGTVITEGGNFVWHIFE